MSFHRLDGLRKHVDKIHNSTINTESSKKCNYCDKIYKRNYHLQNHINDVHVTLLERREKLKEELEEPQIGDFNRIFEWWTGENNQIVSTSNQTNVVGE
jgi:uncharacterized C2H2 Zn-finger protein